MYIKCEDDIFDYDMSFLVDLVSLLDDRLHVVLTQIEQSHDPDSMGLFDDLEYIAGMGFVACQRYLVSTCTQHGLQKNVALEIGPKHAGGLAVAQIVNAAANYWKHRDEWNVTSGASLSRLSKRQKQTIEILETVTPWSDYTCGSLLYEMMTQPQFSELIPLLEEWRNTLDDTVDRQRS